MSDRVYPSVPWLPPKQGRDLPKQAKDDTICVSSALSAPPGSLRPLVEPIHLTKTYEVDDAQDFAHLAGTEGRYAYQRLWNRTSEAAELCIAQLEEAPGALLFNSGVAAVTAVLMTFLRPGDHILTHEPLYSGTLKILTAYLPSYNITWSSISAGGTVDDLKKAVRPNTKMLLVESPCNPDTSIFDLHGLAALGKKLNILTCVDGTFASPTLQKVIRMGVDFSVHSCSKYMGGHTDVIAGSVATRTVEQFQILKASMVYFFGSSLGPFEAYQVHRGMRTLPLRMERHSKNALLVAEALEKHPSVDWVLYPGLKSHPGHETAKKQMKDFGGMVAFQIKGGTQAVSVFTKNLKVASLTPAIGGHETAVNSPYLFSHGPHTMSDEERARARVTEGLIRLSVGLEDGEDIAQDLTQALDAVGKFLDA